jgi:hypothetical protein
MMEEPESTAREGDPDVEIPTVPSGKDVPSPAHATPKISDEEQQKGQTSHPAPADDVGVPPDEEEMNKP